MRRKRSVCGSRHTSMNVPPECKRWRKFPVMLPTVDDRWVPVDKNVGAHDQEEFDDDQRPLLFLSCLISGNCVAEEGETEST